jgi:hypothetical protein
MIDWDKLRKQLDAGLKWARDNRFSVVDNEFGDKYNRCGCILSCAAWAEDSEPMVYDWETAGDKLGIPVQIAESITEGFDGVSPESYNHDDIIAFRLGDEYRKRLSGGP